jgi:hypothetical protein
VLRPAPSDERVAERTAVTVQLFDSMPPQSNAPFDREIAKSAPHRDFSAFTARVSTRTKSTLIRSRAINQIVRDRSVAMWRNAAEALTFFQRGAPFAIHCSIAWM